MTSRIQYSGLFDALFLRCAKRWTPPTQAPPQTPRPRTPPIASLWAWPWVPSSDLRSGLRRSSITTCHRCTSRRCLSRGEVNMPFSPALSSKSYGKVWGRRCQLFDLTKIWTDTCNRKRRLHGTRYGDRLQKNIQMRRQTEKNTATKFLIWIGRCHTNR